MIKLKETVPCRNVLIIEDIDTIEYITKKICGERFNMIFINEDHPQADKIKTLVEPCITILGERKGYVYTYSNNDSKFLQSIPRNSYREIEKLLLDDPELHYAIKTYAEDEYLKIYKLLKNMIMVKDNYIIAKMEE